jgi:superfamily II DNA or RNA helicase
MKSFGDDFVHSSASWAAYERLILRLVRANGFTNSGVVGESGDHGADVLAIRNGKRWLFQAKAYNKAVGSSVIREAIEAARFYGADIPVVVSKSGFTQDAIALQNDLMQQGIDLQLWDRSAVQRRIGTLGDAAPLYATEAPKFRTYQSAAIDGIVSERLRHRNGSALVVLATGLGKTFVAAEAVRRMRKANERVLVLAHTKDLVVQLERAFWPFLSREVRTTVFIGSDKPSNLNDLAEYDYVFATRDSIDIAQRSGHPLPNYDIVIVDECHHLGSEVYERVLNELGVGGGDSGPFLLGLTATPWRPGGKALDGRFEAPIVNVDLPRGLADGYLANVDYRMFTDNVDWDSLRTASGAKLSPKEINRTLFISEWDDAVIEQLQQAWLETSGSPKAIVFCGTIDHAIKVKNKVNALGFANADAIYSGSSKDVSNGIPVADRNKILWDFSAGKINVLCAVDILNEGVDVPDVNIVVFQRVTHSRRIFLQQLGRGLRLAEGKDKVIVLDFVTDIRRFAAGLRLERDISGSERTKSIKLNSKVRFLRKNKSDLSGKQFLAEWLADVEAVEAAGDDVSILTFPRADVQDNK